MKSLVAVSYTHLDVYKRQDLDGMLQKIVELLRANGESWNDTLLISQPDAAGNYTFTAEEGLSLIHI